MKHDEWALTKELGNLRKYGLYLQAERSEKEKKNDKYNIVFQNSRKIVEYYCSIEEIVAISSVLEVCLSSLYEGVKDG